MIEAFLLSITSFVLHLGAPLLVYLSVLFSGESAVFGAFVFAKEGAVPLQVVVGFAFLALLTADIFWFLIGRYLPLRFVPKRLVGYGARLKQHAFLHVLKHHLFLSLCVLKFIIGIRILVIIYIARHPITFTRFLVYDSIGSLIFLGVLGSIAYLYEEGIGSLFPTLHVAEGALIGVVGFTVLSYLLRVWWIRTRTHV